MSLRVFDVLGNSQRLDGGAMFGNAPKALWQRWLEPDELGRIPLACRAALVDDGTRRVLLEAGIGCFFEPELKERYGVVEDRHVLLDSLAQHGLGHEDVDAVVLSHLHFDHAGGVLAEYAAGRPPALLFPNARFIVSEEAFERARSPHLRDRASFIPELVSMLENSGRLVLVPESADHIESLGTNWHVVRTHGHTPRMLHTRLRGKQQSLFFCADLVPGRPWVRLPITMGYDRFPERLVDEKQELFEDFATNDTWLFFTHDTGAAVARLTRDERGHWTPRDVQETLALGLDLDAD